MHVLKGKESAVVGANETAYECCFDEALVLRHLTKTIEIPLTQFRLGSELAQTDSRKLTNRLRQIENLNLLDRGSL